MPILASLGAGSIGAYRLFRRSAAAPGLVMGVDFDGTNDYLTRASDFTGNADGKTFTFSAWVWLSASGVTYTLYSMSAAIGGVIQTNNSGQFEIVLRNSSGTNILAVTCPLPPILTWSHILVSVDLVNASNRSIYINDIAQTPSWDIYTNGNIKFTQTSHNVGISSSSSNLMRGRLAHVYLDYTYRDMSVVSNRRLFITADRKPASDQESLNPIMYLKLQGATTANTNSGTGGNFALQGVVADSSLSPSQNNTPYSDFSGSGTYMTKTNLAGISDTSTFTFSCVFNVDNLGFDNPRFIFYGEPASSAGRTFQVYMSSGRLNVYAYNSAGSTLLAVYTSTDLVIGRNYHFVISVDMTDSSKRHFYLNGESPSLIWSAYVNGTIDFAGASPNYTVGRNGPSDQWYHDGRLGNIFFHTSYIDLSVASNLAKFVSGTGMDAKPVDLGADGSTPLGIQPFVYLPIYGNSAGKNYGSGGDFTTAGAFTGVRSMNEYWGNNADFNGSTGYLSATSLSGISDGKTFSFSFFINPDGSNSSYLFAIDGGLVIRIWNNQNRFDLIGYNSSGTAILTSGLATEQVSSGTKSHICGCIDLSDTGKRFVYLNGTAMTGFAWSAYTNDNIDFTRSSYRIANFSTTYFDGKLSEFYFTTNYIDFSLESNRLRFRDCFGNPTNLSQQITDGTIPNPEVYMRFNPSSFGTNSGTGGNFTVNGTITDAGQL
jgi:hypothetical protein